MMLSRVADNLYWMSRYLERAEHAARLLDVTLDLSPERSAASAEAAWRKLFYSLGSAMNEDPIDAGSVMQIFTFDTNNSNAIASCITSARENARQVREQISSEMWEQINRLYLSIETGAARKSWKNQPHAFFQDVKQGAHLFHGISDSTMNRGEGWHFIQVGQFIERAINLITLLDVNLREMPTDASEMTHDAYLDAVYLLRCCTAWEAYCKVYTTHTRFSSIEEFLLLNEEFPHSVNFAVMMVRNALRFIAETADTHKNSKVLRAIGRMKAMLDFGQIDEIVSTGLHPFLNDILYQCGQIHELLYQTYIHYAVEEKLPA